MRSWWRCVAAGLIVTVGLVACSPDEQGGSTSSGQIDFEAGETHEEQVEEMAVFVSSMEEHFGDDYDLGGGSGWDKEEYLANPSPSPCQGDGFFRTRMSATFEKGIDPQEAEERFNAMTREMGFPEFHPIFEPEDSEQFHVSGGHEGRAVFIRVMDDFLRIMYSAPCSDDESLQEAAGY